MSNPETTDDCMWCRYGDSPYGPVCPVHATNPLYEACVTIIAASRGGDRADVTRDEVEGFWGRVQALGDEPPTGRTPQRDIADIRKDYGL